jgi:hypothetical protein
MSTSDVPVSSITNLTQTSNFYIATMPVNVANIIPGPVSNYSSNTANMSPTILPPGTIVLDVNETVYIPNNVLFGSGMPLLRRIQVVNPTSLIIGQVGAIFPSTISACAPFFNKVFYANTLPNASCPTGFTTFRI